MRKDPRPLEKREVSSLIASSAAIVPPSQRTNDCALKAFHACTRGRGEEGQGAGERGERGVKQMECSVLWFKAPVALLRSDKSLAAGEIRRGLLQSERYLCRILLGLTWPSNVE